MEAKEVEKTRKSYEAFIQTVLDEWGTKIDDLDTRLTRERYERNVGNFKDLDVLRTMRQEAQLRFNKLRVSQEDWDKLMEDVNKSLEEMKLAFERASSTIQ